jgi:hypothetical protein
MHIRHAPILTLATAFALAGCSVFDPGDDVCTLIGCQSGLRVEFSTRPAGPFRVEVTAPGTTPGGPTFVFDCPDPARCGASAVFPDFTPTHVTVRVTTPAGVVTRDFTPAYRSSSPNGEDCEPTCREATVRVEL